MKGWKKATATAALACIIGGTAFFASCTAIAVKGDLVLNQNGSGSRKVTGVIEKGDDKGDGYGQSYYYLKIHGSALETYIENVYAEKVTGSGEWLDVTVNDAQAQETIELSFGFTSFADYTDKLGKLARFGVAEAEYTAPTLTENSNGSVTYTESASVQTSVYKALQTYIMNDETVFDLDCTINGEKQNTAASKDDLKSGVELDKTAPMSIKIGAGAAQNVTADGNQNFTLTANWDGSKVPEKATECVFNYTFDENLTNTGTAGADGNLVLGKGTSAANYVDGVDGKAFSFDGATYLASPNKTYSYNEMTVSFYYMMKEYNATDTGANMVVVPAGLGALNGGVIDFEFIKEDDSDEVKFLVKMNSSNWQVQDKLYTEAGIKLNEWHCYTVVFQNSYDGDGAIDAAYVSVYVDGVRTDRMELSVAAGLKYSLGTFDDGSLGEANGGFNVGGYYENETVKRGCKGVLDNLKIFDGALSAEEVKTLCYTTPVNNGGNGGNTGDNNGGNAGDNNGGSTTEDPGKTEKKKGCKGSVAGAGAACVMFAIGAGYAILRKKERD